MQWRVNERTSRRHHGSESHANTGNRSASSIRMLPRLMCSVALLCLISLPAPSAGVNAALAQDGDEAQHPSGRRYNDIIIPTPAERLVRRGFADTDEGLKAAMNSEDGVAKSLAIAVAQAAGNPVILEEARQLLQEIEAIDYPSKVVTWRGVKLQAARYLADFGDENGLQTLRDLASDPGLLAAAAALAELGDESYAYQFQRVLDRPDLTGIPQYLGSFRSTANPEIERLWLTAARRVKEVILERGRDEAIRWRHAQDRQEEALTRGETAPGYTSPIYMFWIVPLQRGVGAQTVVTPQVLEAFEELAALDHEPSQMARIQMLEHWRSCEVREPNLPPSD